MYICVHASICISISHCVSGSPGELAFHPHGVWVRSRGSGLTLSSCVYVFCSLCQTRAALAAVACPAGFPREQGSGLI